MNEFLKRHRPEAVVLIALVTLIAGATLSASQEQQDGLLDLSSPIATVNGTEIPYSLFYSIIESRVGFETLQNLVIFQIVKLEADRLGIEVSDEEIDYELALLVQYQFGSEEVFLNQLNQARMTLGELRSQIWIELACRAIAMREVPVTEDEVKAFFEEYKAMLYDKGERIEARQILTATEEEANAILEELKTGADFEQLAQEKSLDQVTSVRGGYIGVIERGMMVEEFETAAFGANKGDLVGPVKTDYGYHVIEILEKLDPEPATYEESRQEAEYDLRSTKARSSDSVLIELVAGAELTVSDPKYQGLVDLINGIKQLQQSATGSEQLPSEEPAGEESTADTTDEESTANE
jgi:foldase protein PrsA